MARTALKYITRFAYGRSRAWWVRMQNRGLDVSKMFTDAEHGGKAKALKAAKTFRDTQLPRLEPVRHGITKKTWPYGYVRVMLREFESKRTGEAVTYQAAVAWVRKADGTVASTSYSIDRYGERRAREKALAFVHRLCG